MPDVPAALAEQIEQVAVAKLTPHPENPNEGDVGAIAESVETVGFYSVVFVQRSSGRIVAGEHRWRAAQALGMKTVPVVYLDIDDEQALRIMVADNEIPRQRSRPHFDMLLETLVKLQTSSPAGIAGTGYDVDMLDDLIALHAGPPDLASVLAGAGVPKEGDFWPVIRLVVPHGLKARYDAKVGHLRTDSERLSALLDGPG